VQVFDLNYVQMPVKIMHFVTLLLGRTAKYCINPQKNKYLITYQGKLQGITIRAAFFEQNTTS